MTRLVMLDPGGPERAERMRPYLPEGWEVSVAASRGAADQQAAIKAARYAITGDVPVTAAMMAAPGLVAVHKWGVGYDNIDLEAARHHRVRVLRTTGANAVAVAETTLALILALGRGVVRGHDGIGRGQWRKAEIGPVSFTLTGRTVGIVGMGHIGQALARRLRGFGCPILYAKRTPLGEEADAALSARHVPLDELLRASDVVTLNCELNATTRGLIGAPELALMRPHAILVNAARGGVLDEGALADALRGERLRGAALDVFEHEPIAPDHPLIGMERVILTPHIGALSADGFAASVTRMMSNLAAIEEGRPPREGDLLA